MSDKKSSKAGRPKDRKPVEVNEANLKIVREAAHLVITNPEIRKAIPGASWEEASALRKAFEKQQGK